MEKIMKKYYTIHEVANLLNLSSDAIRLYEKEGLVTPFRDASNDYRYYDSALIHRIMGIHLYRELNVSIAEIHQLFRLDSFSELSEKFSALIASNEQKIEALHAQTEKLRFMQNHFDTLNQGIGTCRVQTLPACYILYYRNSPHFTYDDMKEVLTSPVFSFGNFCYSLKADAKNAYTSDTMQFIVREPMMDICPWNTDYSVLPMREACQCLYTVAASPSSVDSKWDLDRLLAYAAKHRYTPAACAYAFYVYSLQQNDALVDYYEIYLPISENN